MAPLPPSGPPSGAPPGPPSQSGSGHVSVGEAKTPAIIASGAVLTSLAILAVALRFYARYLQAVKLAANDWWILAALVFTTACFVANILSVVLGGEGHDIWELDSETLVTAGKIRYGFEIIFIMALGTTKMSILSLYRRIFTTPGVKLRNAITLMIVFVALWWTASLVAGIFECTPVGSGLWDIAKPRYTGHCFNITAFFIALSVVNIVIDFLILLLPWPVISKLQVSRKQKWGLIILFSLGIFVCLTSIYRLVIIISARHSVNTTWNSASLGIWTIIEPCLAIVCACLPLLRPVLTRFTPKRRLTPPSSPKHPSQDGSSSSSFTKHVVLVPFPKKAFLSLTRSKTGDSTASPNRSANKSVHHVDSQRPMTEWNNTLAQVHNNQMSTNVSSEPRRPSVVFPEGMQPLDRIYISREIRQGSEHVEQFYALDLESQASCSIRKWHSESTGGRSSLG